jgi:hypothetical protein
MFPPSGTKQTIARLRTVGGIPIVSTDGGARSATVKKSMCRVAQGAAMTRILSELLLFSCFAAFVTGIVLAAARLLI